MFYFLTEIENAYELLYLLHFTYIRLLKKKTPHRELLNMVIKSSYQVDINDRQRQSKRVIKALEGGGGT